MNMTLISETNTLILSALTCVAEHLVLHDHLVAVQGLWEHVVVRILVGQIEQHLATRGRDRVIIVIPSRVLKKIITQN